MNTLIEEARAAVASPSLQVLVGDDQPDILAALRLMLKSAGHRAVTADSPAAVLAAAQTQHFDVILIDLNYARDTTSGQEGLDLLNRLHHTGNSAPIIVMTACGNIDLAVEAMRRGASDFVQKPWDNRRLLDTIVKQSRQRAKSEVELARHVQHKLFPQTGLALNTLECAARCVPAREVSGDYYDYFRLDSQHAAFLVADVAGKGMAAALLMANLQALFRSQIALASADPAAMLQEVNRLFFESTPPESYATLFYAQYDDARRILTYANWGHVPPVLIRADASVQRLEPTSTVLGMFAEMNGALNTLQLAPGDTISICSDGVIEAGEHSDREFGEDRLLAMLKANAGQNLQRSIDRVIESVQQFEGADQADDITLMMLRVRA